jgi:uncharacterized protein YqeY
MSSLLEQLQADLKHAMRAGDALRRDEIRGLLAMLKAEQQSKLTRTLSERGLLLDESQQLTPAQASEAERVRASTSLSDEEQQAVLVQRVVQHRQSIDAFRKGKRADLIDAEEAQLAIDAIYLPQLDEAALDAAIQDALRATGAQGPRDLGKVMALLSARLRGRADVKAVAARVQQLLAG